MATATFGAGCFWGVEEIFRTTEGVHDTSVGYTGGTTTQPSYGEVCTGATGHAEVVQVIYNPDVVPYTALLDIFFAHHNPTQLNAQGPDIGTQYRSAIFFEDDTQKTEAEAKKAALVASGHFTQPVVTTLEPAVTFWPAEDYHQNYLRKRGVSSCHI